MQPWRAELEHGGELTPAGLALNSTRRLMELVTSASLACGFHASDPYL
jgi:lactam utilization protein B